MKFIFEIKLILIVSRLMAFLFICDSQKVIFVDQYSEQLLSYNMRNNSCHMCACKHPPTCFFENICNEREFLFAC